MNDNAAAGALAAAEPLSYDAVVEGVYRAAAGNLDWSTALNGITRLMRCWRVQVHGIDLRAGGVAFSFDDGGLSPEADLEYVSKWYRLDPRSALAATLREGQWMSCHEHFPEDFVRSDPFYRDFLIPYGGRYVSGTKLFEDGEVRAFLGLMRGVTQQPLSPEEVEVAQRLGGHLRTAMLLWRGRQPLEARALMGHALLDRLAHPALLVDEHLQLQHANPLASKLMALPDATLRVRGGRLSCAAGNGRLQRALQQLSLHDPNTLDPGTGASPEHLVLPLGGPADDEALVAVMRTLNPAQSLGLFGLRPLVLMLLHDRRMRPRPDAFIVAAVFGMTPAEARVAVRVAQGQGVAELAQDLGIQVSTVRTHLRQAMAKAGARRLPDLAVALASLPGPLMLS